MSKIIDRRNKSMGGGSKRSINQIKNIAVHYSATPTGNTASFEDYWKRQHGWNTGGYHEVVLPDGSVELNYDPDTISNGVGGQNTRMYNICYVGDGQPNTKQLKTLKERVNYNRKRFGLPVSAVKGHREYRGQSTQCPALNMANFRKSLGATAGKPKPVAKPSGTGGSIVDYLKANGINSSFANRKKLATNHGIKNYKGTAAQNTQLLNKLKGNKVKQSAPKKKYSLPKGVLRLGSRGNNVKQVQRALNAANFNVGKVDGIYGAKTDDAVRRFQKVHDAYNVDGIYGSRTRSRLDKVVN